MYECCTVHLTLYSGLCSTTVLYNVGNEGQLTLRTSKFGEYNIQICNLFQVITRVYYASNTAYANVLFANMIVITNETIPNNKHSLKSNHLELLKISEALPLVKRDSCLRGILNELLFQLLSLLLFYPGRWRRRRRRVVSLYRRRGVVDETPVHRHYSVSLKLIDDERGRERENGCVRCGVSTRFSSRWQKLIKVHS